MSGFCRWGWVAAGLAGSTVAAGAQTAPVLEVFNATMTQIVLRWTDDRNDVAAYELLRDASPAFPNPVAYGFTNGSSAFRHKLFADTDRGRDRESPRNKFRGDPADGRPALDTNVVYYYRLKAAMAGGEERWSGVVAARVSGPVRGVEGDLWADVVIGQPDFGQNSLRKTSASSVLRPGGLLHDRLHNKMFVADMNHNRILGFDRNEYRVEATRGKNAPRSTVARHVSGPVFETRENPRRPADRVFGQPGPDGYSAVNGDDATLQKYPHRSRAGADTLALISPGQISMTETVESLKMAVDAAGNLYAPDPYNHRVLRYDRPFASDTVADHVWGQADFEGNQPNRGEPQPAANTLRLSGEPLPHVGVSVDGEGHLWVADRDNNRVLRFPNVNGVPAGEADLVLGQPDFISSAVGDGIDLARLRRPTDVETDPVRKRIYVCDLAPDGSGRLLMFAPPFHNGMAATRRIPGAMNPDGRCIYQLRMDVRTPGIWLRYQFGDAALLNPETGEIRRYLKTANSHVDGNLDFDAEGNLFAVSKMFWSSPEHMVFRRDAPAFTNRTAVFSGAETPSADTLGQNRGGVVFGRQFVVADHYRLLAYNDYSALTNGHAADVVWGQNSFTQFNNPFIRFSYPAVDSKNRRLWVVQDLHAKQTLLAFDYPLTPTSKPVHEIAIADASPLALPVLGGGKLALNSADPHPFAFDPSGETAWIADPVNSRVVRLSGVQPGQRPVVDIVLGQPDGQGTRPNRGRISRQWIHTIWGLRDDVAILKFKVPPLPGKRSASRTPVFVRHATEKDVFHFHDHLSPEDIEALRHAARPDQEFHALYAFTMGYAPAADTLSFPQYVAVDRHGNLYVADSGWEGGNTNMRLLAWNKRSLPDRPRQAVFGLPADRVFGTGGRFDLRGAWSDDPICQPQKPALAPDRDVMVVGMNPYVEGQRFPLVWLDPLDDPVPQFALGDYMSRSEIAEFDREGNLYVSDQNWSRILVYKKPFKNLAPPAP